MIHWSSAWDLNSSQKIYFYELPAYDFSNLVYLPEFITVCDQYLRKDLLYFHVTLRVSRFG